MNKLNKVWKYLTFLNTDLPSDPIGEFKFKGEDYYLTESLIKNEFQDYISITTAQDNFKEEPWRAIPIMVAVLAKRQGESLDDYDLEERAKHFEDLPISIVNRIQVFFYSIKGLLEINSLWYSNRDQIIQKKANDIINTLKKQDGGVWHMRLLRGILLKYIRLLKLHWIKYYNIKQ